MAETTGAASGFGAALGVINPLLGLAASLAPTIYQGILGNKQADQANAISPGARPQYQIPNAAKSALGLQSMLASGNAPGYELAKEDLQAGTANALLQQSKFGNPNVGASYKNLTDAMRGLNIDNMGFRERQMENLVRSYDNFAGYQDKQFDINKMQPYQYALGQSEALKDASIQNQFRALDQGAALGIKALELINNGAEGKMGNVGGGVNRVSARAESVDGTPLATDFTTFKKENPQQYAALSDALKQQSATQGGVITPASNAQVDDMIKMLIADPEAFKKLFQNTMSFKPKTD